MYLYRFIIIALVLFVTSCSNAQSDSESKTVKSRVGQSVSFVKDISVTDLHNLKDSIQLLDVRTPKEVSEGKISGAVSVNIYDADFAKQIDNLKLDKDKELYVYCRSGGRSSQAADKLSKQGFTKVYNVTGGITAWLGKQYPIITK